MGEDGVFMLKGIVLSIFPPETKRGRALKKVAMRYGLAKPFVYNAKYQEWVEKLEKYTFSNPIEDDRISTEELPVFSIVIPMFNTKDKYLEPLLKSIIEQTYSRWELILADASTNEERQAVIKKSAEQDTRIRYVKIKNDGIGRNTNQGIQSATGDYIVFMDHDDTISPFALNEVAIAIVDNKKIDVIYTDEDKMTDNGMWRHTPHFKPDWSPHQYLSCNWTSHLSVVRKKLIDEIGGLDGEMDGSQDYDLILRLHATFPSAVFHHIPKILYHWRVADGSTAGNFDEKSYAIVAGKKAMTRYVEQQGWNATVKSIKDRPGFYHVKFAPNQKRRALVILSATTDEVLNKSLLNKLKQSNSSNIKVDFVTVDDFKRNKKTLLDTLAEDDHIYSISGFYKTIESKWIDELSGVLELENVRAVMPRLITADHYIDDMGIVIDNDGEEHDLFARLPIHAGTPFGHVEWIRDIAKVSPKFYGTTKKQWLSFEKDIDVNDSKKTGTYDVVWTLVDFVRVMPEIKNNISFNPNLHPDIDNLPNAWTK